MIREKNLNMKGCIIYLERNNQHSNNKNIQKRVPTRSGLLRANQKLPNKTRISQFKRNLLLNPRQSLKKLKPQFKNKTVNTQK